MEYRYRGANPDNYIIFNDELYRIIGVFSVDNGTGNIENRIKIIRNESYGKFMYDSGANSHDWARPASLNTELNSNYYNSIKDEYKALIENTIYYLGGYITTAVSKENIYVYERKSSGSNYFYTGNHISWTGKIALMYVSDYGYASSSKCVSLLNSYSNCVDDNWLFSGVDEWILTQYSSYSYSNFYLDNSGVIGTAGVNLPTNNFDVRPVLFLSSKVIITGGNGSFEEPYTLI